MSRTTALRAFLVGAPLAFAALLTQHPMGTGDIFTGVSENVTPWLAVHYGAAVLFPLMALVVWLLIRDLSGRAATSRASRCRCSPCSTASGRRCSASPTGSSRRRRQRPGRRRARRASPRRSTPRT